MYQFINPYNFIPLGSGKTVGGSDEGKDEKQTGYILCELETRTPLIMADTSKETLEEVVVGKNKIKHKVYKETMMINGRPIIPGSELRGMIREKFETLTNSCMSSLEEDLEFYSRYKGNMTEPGLLDLSDKDNMKLYKCKKILVATGRGEDKENEIYKKYMKYETGTCLKFKDGSKKYVRIGREFGGGQPIHLFEKTGEIVHADNEKDFGRMYEEIVAIYKEHLSKEKVKEHSALSKKKMQPIWYEKRKVDGKQYVYFSLGQNGQTKSRKVLKDLVPPNYLPCKDKQNMCEGCRVFGTIQGDMCVHSRVRVEDAYLQENIKDYYDVKKPVVLEELSSPKYTNPMFYMKLWENGSLVTRTAKYAWGVDFCSSFDKCKRKNSVQEMKNNKIMIRGRKEYWHHDPEVSRSLKPIEKTERNVSVIPLRTGLLYTFKVYFDDITKEQLEHLQLAISLGEPTKEHADYCHKLGLGKPLGYGSVKIKVKEIKLRKLDYDMEYRIEDYIPENRTMQQCFKRLDKSTMKALLHMYDFNFIKDNPEIKVEYPKNKWDGLVYEWFMKNNKTILPFADNEYKDIILKG